MELSLSLRESRNAFIIAGLSVGLFAAVMFSLTVGAVKVPVVDVAVILLKKAGLFDTTAVDPTHEVVLTSIRFPRILMTLLIGGALGLSGACLQGLFRNPLVEPSLIGVSGGSAAAVVIVIVFGGSLNLGEGLAYHSLLSMAAFGGGLLATFIVLKLSYEGGKTNIAVLVLIGVAMNALTGAIIGLAIFYADENQLRTFTFWTLGDLGGASWSKLAIAAPLLILSFSVPLCFPQALTVLAVRRAQAFHLGVDVERTKHLMIFFSALAVVVSVSLAGMTGIIGLFVPHLVRVLLRRDH
jgi:iron complex transport system permease protein